MNPPNNKTARLSLKEILAIALIWAAVIYGLSTKPIKAQPIAIAQACR